MTAIQYIDTHSHPHFSRFDDDRGEVFARMREAQVATIAVGTDFQTSKEAIALARAEGARDTILGATIGVHPTEAEKGFDANAFARIVFCFYIYDELR